MLTVLREEQRNHASYLAQLSRDVLEHYLVRQYTHLWITQANCQATEQDFLSRAHKPGIKVQVDNWTGFFCSDGRVDITTTDGRIFFPTWASFLDKAYVYVSDCHTLYVFSLDTFQLLDQQWKRDYVGVYDTTQGDLVEITEPDDRRTITVTSKQDLRRYSLVLPSDPSYATCDFGLVYVFPENEEALIIYDLTSQACLGKFRWVPQLRLKRPIQVTILSPGRLCVNDRGREIILVLT